MLVRLFIFLFFIAGAVLFYQSTKMTYYKNASARDSLDMHAGEKMFTNREGHNIQKAKDHYYADVEKLRTNKAYYEDLGSGIMVASFTVLLFLFLYKVKSLHDLKRIISFNKLWIYVSAILVCLLLIPGAWWYYSLRAERGDYPSWADSIGIPIMIETTTVLIGTVVLVIFIALTTLRSRLPAPMFIRPYRYTITNSIREFCWIILVGFNLYNIYYQVLDGDHVAIFVSLFLLHLLLMLRAGQFNKQNAKQAYIKEWRGDTQ